MPVTYLFEPTGQGTRVVHMAEAPWYDDPTEQARWREDNSRELANLKRLLEGVTQDPGKPHKDASDSQ